MEKLSKLTPVRYMAMIYAPMIIMRLLPLVWWGLVIDLLLVIWIISMIVNSSHQLYKHYLTFTAFVVFNIVFFGVMLWIDSTLVTYIFAFLTVTAFGTQFHHINNVNKHIQETI